MAATISFLTAPKGNAGSGPVDVLVVFGSPATIHGTLTPTEVWRVQEAVAEYRRGQAPFVLFTGGAAANRFVEADVMADLAVSMGVPASAILKERRSSTTMENLGNVAPMLQAHGWHRAEMISTADHLPRIGVLLRGASYDWRLHAAPTPERTLPSKITGYASEAAVTLLLRIFGAHAEPAIHAVARCEYKLIFLTRRAIYRLNPQLGLHLDEIFSK